MNGIGNHGQAPGKNSTSERFFNPTGHHVAAWRHPGTQADAGANFAHYIRLAQTAERGRFDLVFMADSLGVRGNNLAALSHTATRYIAQFEPLTLLSRPRRRDRTDRFGGGLAPPATTSRITSPANSPRSIKSAMDARAGTLSPSSNEAEALNFNRDAHLLHADRYDRAEEFVDVVRGLWDSWEDDAFPRDRDAGQFLDRRACMSSTIAADISGCAAP